MAQTGTILKDLAAKIPADRTLSDADQRKLMYQFAECTVKKRHAGVQRYLATAPGSVESEKLVNKLIWSDCLIGGQISFEEPLYRAAAYDVMYHVDFAKTAPIDFSAVPSINYMSVAEADTNSEKDVNAPLRQLADCAVRHGPVQARQLILSPIGTSVETAAFSAMMPSVSACMTSDVTLKFSKLTLRGFVGEALYRLSALASGRANEAKGG
ncbi:hypothetical protein [Sphingobium aquiterrae]|uniref:hypothetical protein n=1 Tax=Sphingobium aquiterrae TaxID=2038656 RepID=UPI003017CDB6